MKADAKDAVPSKNIVHIIRESASFVKGYI